MRCASGSAPSSRACDGAPPTSPSAGAIERTLERTLERTPVPSPAGSVTRYAAFLRGINLGRQRRVDGSELRSVFEETGLQSVASFRASGNAVFEAPRGPADRLALRIEEQLAGSLGFAVTIFLRTAEETRAIARRRPFPASAAAGSAGKLQVMLTSAG